MSNLSFWFVYFTQDNVYKVKAVFKFALELIPLCCNVSLREKAQQCEQTGLAKTVLKLLMPKTTITRSLHGKFNCITVKYPLKIIHLFNLVNTFCDLFRHICMSPDSPATNLKL